MVAHIVIPDNRKYFLEYCIQATYNSISVSTYLHPVWRTETCAQNCEWLTGGEKHVQFIKARNGGGEEVDGFMYY